MSPLWGVILVLFCVVCVCVFRELQKIIKNNNKISTKKTDTDEERKTQLNRVGGV